VPTQAAGPNIIHILADDLGYGSVGFNGQMLIQTPNLDAIAAGGMRFDNWYSCPVCAPSRATLYTGFHTGHSNVDGNSEMDTGFRADEVMIPQVLGSANYTSAIIGKWGFGATNGNNPTINAPNSLPTAHGFDEFYGYLNHGAAQNYFYPYMFQSVPSGTPGTPPGIVRVANNGGPSGTAQFSHDLFAAQAEQFVANHANQANPFYMEMAYTIPHADIDAIANAPGGFGQYANQPGWTTKQKAYAAMITRMDSSIGSLMDRLRDPNNDGNQADSILNNTLIMFTSDNGPIDDDGEPIDFFDANGPYKGSKFELYEGGIHAPGLAYWNGTIAPGSVSHYRSDLTDFMATAADLAGAETPVGIDGTSLVPILTGQGHLRQRDYLVFEHQGTHGTTESRIGRWAVVRQDGMKLIRFNDESSALYNLITDPGETTPLSLAVPANAQTAAELEANAIAEDVTRGTVQYRTWSGANGGTLHTASNWGTPAGPDRYWSAVVANNSDAAKIAHVTTDVITLGVEIRGQSAMQVVGVHPGTTLTGLNEVRIRAGGRVELDGGTLASSRWVNIRSGGEIAGRGTIAADTYNEGTISPGRSSDTATLPAATLPALAPSSLNTAVVNAATFNFAGVQDDVPVAQTSAKNAYLEITHGLDFGPGVGPRWNTGNKDRGNEFNLTGHSATSLAQAIANNDYVTFTVNPAAGAGFIPSNLNFSVWREDAESARSFALFSSIGGFSAGAALSNVGPFSATGSGSPIALSANISSTVIQDGPIEFRLYAWGAANGGVPSPTGNVHLTAASLSAQFKALSTLEFNFAGVQDGAPLTDLKRQDSSVVLTQGLSFASGVAPAGINNAGNEFHVAGFSTGANLQSAIDNNDYLTFAVQPVAGMVMYPDSVSFSLWRQGSGSATDYAVMSSVAGFATGQQVASTHLVTTGAANTLALGGPYLDPQPTANSVEFRLYGWNATSALDSTHVVAASIRARFASVPGATVDPTGAIAVQGDFYHLAEGNLEFDLAGIDSGINYDAIDVTGKIDLAGNLTVNLADTGNGPFAPLLGDTFSVLTAAQGITGTFANVALPTLAWNLDWRLDYLANAVNLVVWSSGDFNHDGLVGAADYVVWRKNGGTQADLDTWRSRFGLAGGIGAGLGSASAAVPEPSSALLIVLASSAHLARRRRRTT
jgi:arylsulfatase A-like enzyme